MYNHVNEKAQTLGTLQVKRNFAHVCMGFEMRDYQEPRLCTATPAAKVCISAVVNGQKIWSTEDYSMLEKRKNTWEKKKPQVKGAEFFNAIQLTNKVLVP